MADKMERVQRSLWVQKSTLVFVSVTARVFDAIAIYANYNSQRDFILVTKTIPFD